MGKATNWVVLLAFAVACCAGCTKKPAPQSTPKANAKEANVKGPNATATNATAPNATAPVNVAAPAPPSAAPEMELNTGAAGKAESRLGARGGN
jgi:hypothetical protein